MNINKIANIIFLVVVVITAFFYKENLKNIYVRAYTGFFPCSIPIEYSIGTFDTRFGISKADFLKDMTAAEQIWESALGKQLFKYSENGSLKVNLVYDNRQDSTLKLKKVSDVVTNSQASYNTLKAHYNSVLSEYNQMKYSFESRLSAYNSRKSVYDSEVASLNRSGGADKTTYNRLNTERNYLSTESANLKVLQDNLNAKVTEVNSVTDELNQLAKSLNISVNSYNKIGDTLGGEFDEGLYKSSSSGEEIDIYQFDNQDKLIRVLTHELGHALGLDHVNDTKAIMYKLNTSTNNKLTDADLAELKTVCKVK